MVQIAAPYHIHYFCALFNFSPEFEAPTPLPETTENVVCALGLVVGLVGIITGTIFIIKGVRKGNTAERPGPL